jgi:hypothetical protein
LTVNNCIYCIYGHESPIKTNPTHQMYKSIQNHLWFLHT